MFCSLRPLFKSVVKNARCISDAIPDGYKLTHVMVFHRHGDRSPLYNYYEGLPKSREETKTWRSLVPSSSEIVKLFPDNIVISNQSEYRDIYHCTPKNILVEDDDTIGADDGTYGQLSYVGMQEMRNLGKIILNRYRDEIEYTQGQHNVIPYYGTVACRTQLSAFCIIDELYKQKNLPLPPVYVTSKESCILNRYNPHLKGLCNERMKQPDFQSLEFNKDMNEHIIQLIQKETKYIWRDLLEYGRLYDFINTHKKHHLPIHPEIESLYELAHFFMMHKYLFIYTTPAIFKETCSPLAAYVSSHITQHLLSPITIFSAHDTTLLSLLYMLSPESALKMPPYASYIALEYYTPKDASSLQPPVVSMIYNNKYIPIYIYQQEKYRYCPLDKFMKILSLPNVLSEQLDTMRCDYLNHALHSEK